jgi:hypothetical protein
MVTRESEWAEKEVTHSTGLTTFFGIDESYESERREALERLFTVGEIHVVAYTHLDPPPHCVSLYAIANEDALDDIGVFVGTAWRDDRLPDLLEILLAFKDWPPTKDLACSASWSKRQWVERRRPEFEGFDSAPDIQAALKSMCQGCGHSPLVHGEDRKSACIVGTDPRGKRARCPCKAFVSS